MAHVSVEDVIHSLSKRGVEDTVQRYELQSLRGLLTSMVAAENALDAAEAAAKELAKSYELLGELLDAALEA